MFKKKFTAAFEKQYVSWLRSQPRECDRIDELCNAVCTSPFTGIGRPEALQGDYEGKWSRRINQKDRLIYSVDGDSVIFEQCRGHYNDR